jgi:hypothetical protein
VECAIGAAAPDKVNLSPASPDDTKPKLGFASLARGVAARWKTLDSATKVWFEESARLDKLRYQTELTAWRANQVKIQSAVPDESGNALQSQCGTKPILKSAPMEHLKVVTPEKKTKTLWHVDSINHPTKQSDGSQIPTFNSPTSSVPNQSSLALSCPFSLEATNPGFASLAQVQSPLRALTKSSFGRDNLDRNSRRSSSLPLTLPMGTRLFSESMASPRASAADSILASHVDSRVTLLQQCQMQRLVRQQLSQPLLPSAVAACHKPSWTNPSNWPGTGQFYSVDEIDVSMRLQELASAAERPTRAQASSSTEAVSKEMLLLMGPCYGMNAPR